MALARLLISAALLSLDTVRGNTDAEPYSITPLNNTGVLFEEIGKLQVFHSKWTIFTEIDILEIENQTALADHAEHLISQICKTGTFRLESCQTQQLHIHSIVENIKRRTHIIRELIPRSRRTRSLLDGVGNAMHYLFGTMDSGNEQEVYSRLDQLEHNEQVLADLEKQQISVIKAAFHDVQKPLSSLSERQRQIAYQVNDLHNITDNVIKTQVRQEIITNLLLQTVEIEFRQQALLDILTTSRNGQIHPLLIPPKELLTVYSKTHAIYSNPQLCLDMLYQTAELQPHLLQDKLVIKIVLPIFNMPTYTLHQIFCFPISANGTTIVPNIRYSHIASNNQKQEFLLLTPDKISAYSKLNHRHGTNIYVGKLNTPILNAVTIEECTIKLLLNPLNEPFKCPYKVQQVPRNLLVKLNTPNAWLYSFYSPHTAHVLCSNKIAYSRIIGTGILALKQPCHLRLDEKLLYYEDKHAYNFKFAQPPYFPTDNQTLSPPQLLNISKSSVQPLEVFVGDNNYDSLHEYTQTLEEIQQRVEEVRIRPIREKSHLMATSAITLSSAVVIVLTVYIITRMIKLLLRRRQNIVLNSPDTIELHEIPSEVQTTGPVKSPESSRKTEPGTSRGPQPLKRALTIPQPKAYCLVNEGPQPKGH